jgi:hypothetical protein
MWWWTVGTYKRRLSFFLSRWMTISCWRRTWTDQRETDSDTRLQHFVASWNRSFFIHIFRVLHNIKNKYGWSFIECYAEVLLCHMKLIYYLLQNGWHQTPQFPYIMYHMGRFYNNRRMSVNILTWTTTGNNRKTAICMRLQVNTLPWRRDNNMGETVFSMRSTPSKITE